MSSATQTRLFNLMPTTAQASTNTRSVSDSRPLPSVPGFLSERVRSISDGSKGGVKLKREGCPVSFPPPLCPYLRKVSRDTPPRIRQQDFDDTDSQASSTTDSRWTWRVTPAMLEPVPNYYPLEHSSITIRKIPVHIISARISNFMRTNSIACSYRFGTAMVHCTTSQLTKFSLNLWRGKKSSVILELRRLQGCCWEMLKVRNDLFQAVTTGQAQAVRRTSLEDRVASRLLQEMYHQNQNDDLEQDSSCQEYCLQLLQSDYRDQNRLGMESLSVISKPTCRESAESLSRSLIFNKGEAGSRLRESLVEYFYSVERPSDTVDSDDEFSFQDYVMDQEPEYARGNHFGDMHNLALQVLTNALEVATTRLDNSSSSATLLNQRCDFWSTVVEALVYNLTVSCYRPHEAALSARCLFLFTELVPATCQVMEDRLLPALIEANEYGKSHHLKLEMETQNLMERLVQTPLLFAKQTNE